MTAVSLGGVDTTEIDDASTFLARSAALAVEATSQPGHPGLDLLERELDHLLSAAARACAPDPFGTPVEPDSPSAPATLDRAIHYIETHAAEPIKLADIATAAGLSPRALQSAFRRYRGTTPLRYLHHVRLELAHRDLQAARPGDGQTVSAIASRWGFVQLSRFARDYQARYGVLPRRTLAEVGP